MATTPRNIAGLPAEFRAPPPSPAGGAHNGSDTKTPEDDEFSGFLNRSLRVPQLILPDKIFHREAVAPWTPPEIDLESLDAQILVSAARSVGCFQIVNHGIERGLIEDIRVLAEKAFRLPPERKRMVTRSGAGEWGFEADEEEEEEGEEFFWWSRWGDEKLAGIWPQGYKDFRNKMQCLWTEMEKIANKIANKIGLALLQNDALKHAEPGSSQSTRITGGSAICLHKHGQSETHNAGGQGGSLKHDILRMLIRSSICSHSLCLHVCKGSSRFCAYSKKGCAYFPVKDDAIVVTVGDQIQAWSGGLYKHVAGKPIFQNEEEEASISIGFLYSHPLITDASSSSCSTSVRGERIISLTEQIMVAACLAFLYHIMVYIYNST